MSWGIRRNFINCMERLILTSFNMYSFMYKKDFKYFKEHYDESIEKMFAAVSDLYAQYWHDFFHFALFDKKKQSWRSAFKRTHKRYLQDLKVKTAKNVLELACGRGRFTYIIAKNTKGNVLGIDISKSQLSHTKRFKRKNLRFKHHDIMKVDELNEKFDAVIFLDAACYLPDKEKALQKISKVMNSGARLLILDWCKAERLNALQEELVLYPFMRYWAIPSLETRKNYEKYFKKSGFKILKIMDMNIKVKKDWEFGYENALKALKKLSVNDLPKFIWKRMKLGSEGLRLIKEQFPAAIYIKVGYDIGFLRYVYFLVEKE